MNGASAETKRTLATLELLDDWVAGALEQEARAYVLHRNLMGTTVKLMVMHVPSGSILAADVVDHEWLGVSEEHDARAAAVEAIARYGRSRSRGAS